MLSSLSWLLIGECNIELVENNIFFSYGRRLRAVKVFLVLLISLLPRAPSFRLLDESRVIPLLVSRIIGAITDGRSGVRICDLCISIICMFWFLSTLSVEDSLLFKFTMILFCLRLSLNEFYLIFCCFDIVSPIQLTLLFKKPIEVVD